MMEEDRDKKKNEEVVLPPEAKTNIIKPDTDTEKHLEDIDNIELAISEIVNQVENKRINVDKKAATTSASFKDDIHTNIEENLIFIESSEVNEEENKARVALQQLESINFSSRRKKKPEIGSVVCTKKLQPSTLDNDDLIAILQGTDDIVTKNGNGIKEEVIIEGEGHFEVLDIIDDDKNKNEETDDSSSPQKNRKRKQDFKSDLVSSIASEWSDDEDNEDSKKSSKIVEEPSTQEENVSSEMKIPEITPFKRTRVIKRKIIWDPDAPETWKHASLIQPKNKISPNQTKEQIKKRVTSPVRKKVTSTSPSDKKQELADKKQKNTGPLMKKKKQSEIDRLLSDEGAANMLNSLEQQAEQSTIFDNKNKRASSKSKPSEQWDYVYNSTSVDSMIARRRSTSSYSSTSPHRNSFDATPTNSTLTQNDKNNEIKKRTKHFEFAKPEAKRTTKKDEGGNESNRSYDMVSEIKKSVEKKKNSESFKQKESANKMKKDSDDVVLKKNGNVFNLLVDTKSSKSKNMFTIKMLKKMCEMLDVLQDDDECKVVMFSSSGQNFCQGLDFSDLINASEKRNKTCQEWTEIISAFFRTLIKFTKPLIAAVQGNVSGLGVMMIPLFDITICSEKSSFETGYIKSGQFPEGYCFFNATVNTNLVKKIIWLGEKISSSEAVSHAFITRTTTPQKIFEDTLSCAKKMCTYSQEVYKNIKKARLSKIGTNNILEQLKSDEQTLSSSLVSETFCENYRSFLSRGSW